MTARRILRAPAVAGSFYPSDPVELRAVIDQALAAATNGPGGAPSRALGRPDPPKAIVVPHAGYVYSGPIAASAYARLSPRAYTIRRVVVLGPAHRVPVRSMVVSAADAWRTPLGEVAIDVAARDIALTSAGVIADDDAHAPEHSIEVQVPFLQVVLRSPWKLLPIVVGGATTAEVADLLERLWGGPETLVVISSDLSHYHRSSVARRLDAATAAAIVSRDAEHIDPDRACGAHPLRGLLEVARRHDLTVDLLDLRTSADTAGEPSRVVGYGAFSVR